MAVIQITIQYWLRCALPECLEHDDCLWIVGGKGVSLDGYLNEYEYIIFFYLNSLTDKNKILQ